MFDQTQRSVPFVNLQRFSKRGLDRIDDRRRIVINARRPPLKKRCDDHHIQIPRQARQGIGRRPGNRFREIEQLGVLFAAEILRAKKLL